MLLQTEGSPWFNLNTNLPRGKPGFNNVAGRPREAKADLALRSEFRWPKASKLPILFSPGTGTRIAVLCSAASHGLEGVDDL